MKILKILLFAVIALVIVLVIVGALLPAASHVERSIVIDAPPEHVFQHANNFRNFNEWSPWYELDPEAEYTFSGPDQGVGAKMAWQSEHDEVGSGSQEIVQSQANELIKVFLDFGDMGVADASYILKPQREGTDFTWAFETEHGWNLVSRYIGLMMDKWLGPVYEKGLTKLKQVAEADYKQQQAATPAKPKVITEEIQYSVDGEPYTGYLAYGDSAEPKPGVLVVHEWWGHSDYVRQRATMLAELGYTALALDMYGTGKIAEHPGDAQKFMQAVTENAGAAQTRFAAALEILRANPRVEADKIAAIGYCFGGATVLNMARAGMDLDGVVSFHGSLGTETPAKEGDVQARVLVLHGNADTFIPEEEVKAFKAEMDAASVDYEFVGYDGAKHSFTNPAATAKAEKYDIPLAYNAAADEDSWQRMQVLFEEIFAQ